MNDSIPACPSPVTRAVPYLHVADVEQSVEFYSAFGFLQEGDRYLNPSGQVVWASVCPAEPSGALGAIFFALASGPIVPEEQAVLLYLYCKDAKTLRRHLLDCGLHDGGAYCGQAGPNQGRRVVFDVNHPHYMPNGEIRVADPDGYCLLIGQLEPL
jgi:hypothetical protein